MNMLLEAAHKLLNRNAAINGHDLILPFDSHIEAITCLREVRELIAAAIDSREATGSPGAPRDCPFCEQDTVVGVEVVETPGVHYACCLNCAARGPLSGTAGLAIEAWNERYAASKPAAEALGSDQQGNRASQEPPVAGVRATAPVSAEMQSAVDAVLGKPDPYTLR